MPPSVEEVIRGSCASDREEMRLLADEGYVVCPLCEGSGESEHWTTCGLCGMVGLCRPDEAREFNGDKIFTMISELESIGLRVESRGD